MVAEGGGKFPLEGEGGYLRKKEHGFFNPQRPHLLCVQDPNNAESDVVSALSVCVCVHAPVHVCMQMFVLA